MQPSCDFTSGLLGDAEHCKASRVCWNSLSAREGLTMQWHIKHQTWANMDESCFCGACFLSSLSLASLKMYLLDINIDIPPEFHVGFSSDKYISWGINRKDTISEKYNIRRPSSSLKILYPAHWVSMQPGQCHCIIFTTQYWVSNTANKKQCQ